MEAVARDAGITRAVILQHSATSSPARGSDRAGDIARAHAGLRDTLADLSAGGPQELMLESLAAPWRGHAHPVTWRLVLMPPLGAPESLRKSIAEGRQWR